MLPKITTYVCLHGCALPLSYGNPVQLIPPVWLRPMCQGCQTAHSGPLIWLVLGGMTWGSDSHFLTDFNELNVTYLQNHNAFKLCEFPQNMTMRRLSSYKPNIKKKSVIGKKVGGRDGNILSPSGAWGSWVSVSVTFLEVSLHFSAHSELKRVHVSNWFYFQMAWPAT